MLKIMKIMLANIQHIHIRLKWHTILSHSKQ